VSPSCSPTAIAYKGAKLWRFDNMIREFLANFHCAYAETAIYELSVKNLTPSFGPATSISYKTYVVPLLNDVYIYSMFCATTSRDLDIWPFDLDSVSYRVPLMPDPDTNFDCPMIVGYWVMNYWIWSHFRYQEQSLRMRSITWSVLMVFPKTSRNNILTPNCLFTIRLLRGYDDD